MARMMIIFEMSFTRKTTTIFSLVLLILIPSTTKITSEVMLLIAKKYNYFSDREDNDYFLMGTRYYDCRLR